MGVSEAGSGRVEKAPRVLESGSDRDQRSVTGGVRRPVELQESFAVEEGGSLGRSQEPGAGGDGPPKLRVVGRGTPAEGESSLRGGEARGTRDPGVADRTSSLHPFSDAGASGSPRPSEGMGRGWTRDPREVHSSRLLLLRAPSARAPTPSPASRPRLRAPTAFEVGRGPLEPGVGLRTRREPRSPSELDPRSEPAGSTLGTRGAARIGARQDALPVVFRRLVQPVSFPTGGGGSG